MRPGSRTPAPVRCVSESLQARDDVGMGGGDVLGLAGVGAQVVQLRPICLFVYGAGEPALPPGLPSSVA
jgi:hypothetical protein